MAKAKSSKKNRNIGLKVISLVLALLLEIYFYSPDNSVTVKVPALIEVRNVPAELMIVEPAGAERGIPAVIEVRGPGPLVAQVKASPARIPIVFPPGEPREFTGVVDPQNLQLPSGVEVLNIDPLSIEIRSERVARKELLVVVERTGEPAPGFKVEELNVFPDTVLVRGPLSIVEDLRAVETKPLDISDLSTSARRAASLKTFGPLVTLDVTMVTVDVKVAPVEKEASFPSVPVKALAGSGFIAQLDSPDLNASATVQGPAPVLAELEKKGLVLLADARSLEEGQYDVRLSAELPEGVKLVASSPGKVKVTVVRKDG